MVASKGIGRVNQDDVCIAGELQVLKAVIEHKPIDAVARKCLSVRVAIGTDTQLDVMWHALAIDSDFVALWLARCAN
jgi:hypothetical protein